MTASLARDGCVAFGNVVETLRADDERMPVRVTAELTRRCTFACTHCYCRLPREDAAISAEMRGDEWARILAEAASEGAVSLLVTGGEPLLHPDFRGIWVAAKRLGLIPDLYTNASLVTPEVADFLARWPPRRVSITLYGATEGTHRAMTGREGMLDRVLEAAGLLRDRGLGVEMKGVFTRTNAHEFAGVRARCQGEGRPFRWDAELIGRLKGSHGNPAAVRLPARQIVELERSDAVRWAEWGERLASWKPARESPESPFRCRIGRSGFHVDPWGILRACEFVETVAYDVRRGSVREGWRRAIPEALGRFSWSPGPCQKCSLADVCRVCPGRAVASGQPAAGPTEMHCELGRARACSFGLPASPRKQRS